mgnify:CR=1 FL=1
MKDVASIKKYGKQYLMQAWSVGTRIKAAGTSKTGTHLPRQLEGAKCKEKLLRKCKNARLEYSFEYPGANLTNKEIRRASIKSRDKILQKIIL